MINLDRSRIELTESQLLTIKDRIKSWSTKDQVIEIMRYRYGRLEDQAASIVGIEINQQLSTEYDFYFKS